MARIVIYIADAPGERLIIAGNPLIISREPLLPSTYIACRHRRKFDRNIDRIVAIF